MKKTPFNEWKITFQVQVNTVYKEKKNMKGNF